MQSPFVMPIVRLRAQMPVACEHAQMPVTCSHVRMPIARLHAPISIERLRAQMHALAPVSRHGVLALDGGAMDAALGGGLTLGALHTVEGVGIEAETGAIPAAFVARLLARLDDPRPVMWIAPSTDLYAPGLIGLGFDPARLIQLRSPGDQESWAAMEITLRSATAAAVITEGGQLGTLAGRRLHMACLRSGSTGFVLRRWPYGRKTAEPIVAAVTSWRLSAAPSLRIGREPGLARWRAELLHSRGGPPAEWIIEQENRSDAPHPFRVAARLADPPLAARQNAG